MSEEMDWHVCYFPYVYSGVLLCRGFFCRVAYYVRALVSECVIFECVFHRFFALVSYYFSIALHAFVLAVALFRCACSLVFSCVTGFSSGLLAFYLSWCPVVRWVLLFSGLSRAFYVLYCAVVGVCPFFASSWPHILELAIRTLCIAQSDVCIYLLFCTDVRLTFFSCPLLFHIGFFSSLCLHYLYCFGVGD